MVKEIAIKQRFAVLSGCRLLYTNTEIIFQTNGCENSSLIMWQFCSTVSSYIVAFTMMLNKREVLIIIWHLHLLLISQVATFLLVTFFILFWSLQVASLDICSGLLMPKCVTSLQLFVEHEFFITDQRYILRIWINANAGVALPSMQVMHYRISKTLHAVASCWRWCRWLTHRWAFVVGRLLTYGSAAARISETNDTKTDCIIAQLSAFTAARACRPIVVMDRC